MVRKSLAAASTLSSSGMGADLASPVRWPMRRLTHSCMMRSLRSSCLKSSPMKRTMPSMRRLSLTTHSSCVRTSGGIGGGRPFSTASCLARRVASSWSRMAWCAISASAVAPAEALNFLKSSSHSLRRSRLKLAFFIAPASASSRRGKPPPPNWQRPDWLERRAVASTRTTKRTPGRCWGAAKQTRPRSSRTRQSAATSLSWPTPTASGRTPLRCTASSRSARRFSLSRRAASESSPSAAAPSTGGSAASSAATTRARRLEASSRSPSIGRSLLESTWRSTSQAQVRATSSRATRTKGQTRVACSTAILWQSSA
mmetsp:Transcript_17808/g.55816  ORF Transcript_17808/g.55816 Transcript_17808/m.55816 type:complete len:314 (+) Transcript_17808:326-1267(+)